MEFQQALEQAMVNVILAEVITSPVKLTADNCKRMYDGRPRPTCGNWFVSVWGRNWKQNRMRTCFDEYFRVFVTVTRRLDTRAFDHWVEFRDEVDALATQLIAIGHRDSWNWVISNEMNSLAALTWDPNDAAKRIGAAEALQFEEASDLQDVGPEWFNAKIIEGQFKASDAGCQATIRFTPIRRVQNILTAR